FPPCHNGQFRCSNALCIPASFHCDGFRDCMDGTDEQNCTAIACPENKFLCPRGGLNNTPKCISRSQLCDGKKDCEDSADEETACSTSSCSSLGCEYKCQASLTGGACYCPEGRKVANDSRSCIDHDECAEWGFCDQLCTNTDGSYKCSCAPGYGPIDRTHCAAANSSALMLYFVHDRSVWRINPRLKPDPSPQLIANTTGASGLDYHYDKNMLFWSDVKTRKVLLLHLHLVHTEQLDHGVI
ncbi:unnamed protein product, partial [Timema podura]|nr:unnamed protein product [Timema podura]